MQLQLDMQTVFVLLVLGHLFTVILITAYKHKQAKDLAVNTFYISKWLQSATWTIMGIQQMHSHMLLIMLANALFLLGVSLETIALLRVAGGFTARARSFYRGFALLAIGGYCFIVLFHNSEALRITIVSLAVAIFLLQPVFYMIASPRRTMLRLIVGYMYLIIGVALVARAILVWLPIIPVSMFDPGLYQNLSFTVLYLVMVLGNTGFILLSKEKADRDLLKLASFDDLTGAMNRRTFMAEARNVLGQSVRKKFPVSFVLLDIDFFKQINDSFGHDAGDRVLEKISSIIFNQLDSRALFGRFGGDEFAILLPGADIEEGNTMAERIRRSVEGAQLSPDIQASTISMGIVTVCSDHQIPIEELYTSADQALYQAKQLGRNCVSRTELRD